MKTTQKSEREIALENYLNLLPFMTGVKGDDFRRFKQRADDLREKYGFESLTREAAKRDAFEHEVPLPETCIALDWNEPTFHVWANSSFKKYKYPIEDYVLCYIKDKQLYKVSDHTYYHDVYDCDVLPKIVYAPTARKIAQVLPRLISYKGQDFVFNFDMEANKIYYVCINYYHRLDRIFEIGIQNYNYAQGYAEMNTELRNAGLLGKEG